VSFIDDHCNHYRYLAMCGTHEAFKFLHLGMISELPRKSLPAIAKVLDHRMLNRYIIFSVPVAGRTVSSQAVRVDKTVGWKTFNYLVY